MDQGYQGDSQEEEVGVTILWVWLLGVTSKWLPGVRLKQLPTTMHLCINEGWWLPGGCRSEYSKFKPGALLHDYLHSWSYDKIFQAPPLRVCILEAINTGDGKGLGRRLPIVHLPLHHTIPNIVLHPDLIWCINCSQYNVRCWKWSTLHVIDFGSGNGTNVFM